MNFITVFSSSLQASQRNMIRAKKICWVQVAVLFLISKIECQSTEPTSIVQSGDEAFENSIREKCDSRYDAFHHNWTHGQLRLTTYLEDLRTWECPQYSEECEKRIYALNNFTTLVYDRFCNYDNFSNLCMEGKLTA